ncbi:sulfite exporter TauE/SafE family protein [uncultured Tateyamaria sp.]|uniref:sulfite exporter TauE/SafE family protein n=1 Tax=uncultured Tateyamaria sp. TaxID=455651 RepID=UPI00263A33F0|nr:sulfite exporter TauE/SafE family protein [uncultured Tateyamaria sp.]
MEMFFDLLSPQLWLIALSIAVLGGVVKGVVGFAMPMVVISGLSSIMEPEIALAGLILPTLVANGTQALGQGIAPAWASARRFWVYLTVGGVVLVASAQLVRVLPISVLLGLIGVPVVLFALLQLAGWQLALARQRKDVEAGIGAFAGFLGGISGIWGPPTVLYLTALNTEKAEQMRVQGVIYGLGAIALVGAHIGSGVLRAETLPLSLALIAPALLGQWLGGKVLDRIDQVVFKKATLFILLVVGLNLIRRSLVA